MVAPTACTQRRDSTVHGGLKKRTCAVHTQTRKEVKERMETYNLELGTAALSGAVSCEVLSCLLLTPCYIMIPRARSLLALLRSTALSRLVGQDSGGYNRATLRSGPGIGSECLSRQLRY